TPRAASRNRPGSRTRAAEWTAARAATSSPGHAAVHGRHAWVHRSWLHGGMTARRRWHGLLGRLATAAGPGGTAPGVAAPPSEAATGAPDNGTGVSTQPDGGASQAVGAGPSAPEPNGRSVAADHAGADAGRGGGPVPPGSQVPGWLQRAAGWSWRLLLVGIVIYLAFRVASVLRVVVLPCVAALLLTALLQPLTSRLRRLG